MPTFLRVVALLVAIVNYYVFLVSAVLYESEGIGLSDVFLDAVPLVYAFAFCTGALLAVESLHPYARSWLEARFLLRYLALVAGTTLGGLLAGLTLSVGALLVIPP